MRVERVKGEGAIVRTQRVKGTCEGREGKGRRGYSEGK